VNGEAIYGTRPWAVYGEGPTEVVGGSFNDTKRQAFTGQDIRFTTKPGALYAIALAWPGKTFTVKALGTGAAHAKGRVTGVRLLGHEGALSFTQDAAGLHVTLPEKAPGEHAFAFRIEGVS
jgi:alpha-L-fucosidase